MFSYTLFKSFEIPFSSPLPGVSLSLLTFLLAIYYKLTIVSLSVFCAKALQLSQYVPYAEINPPAESPPDSPTFFLQNLQIPLLGFRIAGDVDEFFWTHTADSIQKFRRAARPRRIHKYDVYFFASCRHLLDGFGCIFVQETGVLDSIIFCILNGTSDGTPIFLDTQNVPCMRSSGKSDCPNSAVGVQNGLGAVKPGRLDGLSDTGSPSEPD